MNYALKKRLRYSLGAFSIFTPSVCAIRLEDKYFSNIPNGTMVLWYFRYRTRKAE